jgi:hypothetical protein
MFKGITREKREKVLSGIRFKNSPPVGLYSPKFNFVLSEGPKGIVKFDSSPKRVSDQKSDEK